MARVIALANQKGGSGKSTTTANLGACLAEMGHRVLLVDLDPQGNLTLCMGHDVEALDRTIYNVLMDPKVGLEQARVGTAVSGVDLVPANIDLCGAEIQLIQEIGRERVLAQRLEPAREEYDYILIDCPPSLGLLVLNALTAADEVLVPLQCSFLALRGLGMLVETIEKAKARVNPSLELTGILLTMQDSRTVHAREVEEIARQRFGRLVYATVVHRSVRFDEATARGEPITVYARDSRGADQYRELAQEVHHGQGQIADPAGAAR
jgi:chromosome partitioning protein